MLFTILASAYVTEKPLGRMNALVSAKLSVFRKLRDALAEPPSKAAVVAVPESPSETRNEAVGSHWKVDVVKEPVVPCWQPLGGQTPVPSFSTLYVRSMISGPFKPPDTIMLYLRLDRKLLASTPSLATPEAVPVRLKDNAVLTGPPV